MSIDTNGPAQPGGLSMPGEDDDLGLADLDPIEPPADVWDAAVTVAVDPDTPAPDADLLPDLDAAAPDASLDDDAALAGGDIDLSEFDDADGVDDDFDDLDSSAAHPGAEHDFGPPDESVHQTFTEADPFSVSGTYDEGADFLPEDPTVHGHDVADGAHGSDTMDSFDDLGL